ncbi:MAG: chromosomal replication initiator protein DnaA [Bacilli bacterium]|nr:chromosomal replication initiator protein DnaA [Bacilli bacterium]
MNVDIVWSKLLSKLKDKLSTLSFNTWFSETELYKLQDGKAIIIVPMLIHKRNLGGQYSDLISSLLYEITNSNYELIFCLKEDIEEEEENNNKIEIVEEKIEEKQEDFSYKANSNLNKNYTFENFIVGNSNKFAQAAALSVAENPGKIYNPLFLYGNSGVGKTHLMHAIGNYIGEHSNKRVLYVTSEQFVDEFVKTNRKDENGTNFNYVEFFKNKYRNIDVLIIDDIQYLGGAQQSQQEFFHTFNNLYNDSKQIIVSSDRSPDDLKQLEERLRTRFSFGLGVNISPPDYNLRRDIIKKKIIANNFEKDIPDDVIEYIASNIGPDVRHLEGAITRLVAYSTIMGGEEITLELAIEALKDFNSKGMGEKNDIYRIQKIVSEHFQISVDDIRSKKRSSNISFPRQIAMYLCRNMTNESFPKIGIEFGGKDHSTVMHSVEKIEKEMKDNKDLYNIIEKLKKDIGVV